VVLRISCARNPPASAVPRRLLFTPTPSRQTCPVWDAPLATPSISIPHAYARHHMHGCTPLATPSAESLLSRRPASSRAAKPRVLTYLYLLTCTDLGTDLGAYAPSSSSSPSVIESSKDSTSFLANRFSLPVMRDAAPPRLPRGLGRCREVRGSRDPGVQGSVPSATAGSRGETPSKGRAFQADAGKLPPSPPLPSSNIFTSQWTGASSTLSCCRA